MRNRRHVDDVRNLEADRIQRADRRLTTRTRPVHSDFKVLQTMLLSCATRVLGSNLRRERSRLAGAAKTGATAGCPRQGIALPVSDRDDGVVERRMHVSDSVNNDLLCL